MATTGARQALEIGRRVAIRLIGMPRNKIGIRLAASLFVSPTSNGTAKPDVGTSRVIEITPELAEKVQRLRRFLNVRLAVA